MFRNQLARQHLVLVEHDVPRASPENRRVVAPLLGALHALRVVIVHAAGEYETEDAPLCPRTEALFRRGAARRQVDARSIRVGILHVLRALRNAEVRVFDLVVVVRGRPMVHQDGPGRLRTPDGHVSAQALEKGERAVEVHDEAERLRGSGHLACNCTLLRQLAQAFASRSVCLELINRERAQTNGAAVLSVSGQLHGAVVWAGTPQLRRQLQSQAARCHTRLRRCWCCCCCCYTPR
mmetsp:Transcript_3361/g.12616  ORF Transcript_3361/g.12616 Transcript_3361/m.12616 type:complete len:237 (+) Transcript_3361:238-948(+)